MSYYQKHKEERIKYQKEYNLKNKEYIKEYQHRYFVDHYKHIGYPLTKPSIKYKQRSNNVDINFEKSIVVFD